MNRAARRLRLFESSGDYQLLLMCLIDALEAIPMRLLAYCVMPNHFHLVVWPNTFPELSRFMKLVTGMHSQRWPRQKGSLGTGCVYQGRYRAVPVEHGQHFLVLCRYVERNALRVRLVERAEDWPWSSAYQRCTNSNTIPLRGWRIPQPANWLIELNLSEARQDSDAVRRTTAGGLPFGSKEWARMAAPARNSVRGRPRTKTGSGGSLRSAQKAARPRFSQCLVPRDWSLPRLSSAGGGTVGSGVASAVLSTSSIVSTRFTFI
jgi:putative transposase